MNVGAAIGGVGPYRIVKLSDESRQSTTTPANDGTLFVNLPASSTFEFRMGVYFATPSTGGFKYWIDFNVNSLSSTTMRHAMIAPGATVWSNLHVDTAANVAYSTTAVGEGYVEVHGRAVINGVADNFCRLMWCQQASQASNTTVRGGSWLEYSQAV